MAWKPDVRVVGAFGDICLLADIFYDFGVVVYEAL